MSGISSSGLFSGLDVNGIIGQLMAIEARPQALARQRLIQLQTEQAAVLDINGRVNALKTAAASFRLENVFASRSATSSSADILSASASKNAQVGSFTFSVDRLVSSQQALSRGFIDRDSSPVGLPSLTIESANARLDRDAALADLRNGAGIERGRIRINDGTTTATVDLSRAETLADVVEAINAADGINVTASVRDGALSLQGASSVSSLDGRRTAEDLGLAGKPAVGGVIAGDRLSGIGTATTLATLNDGSGVDIGSDITFGTDGGGNPTAERYDLTINGVQINLGEVWTYDTDAASWEVSEGKVTDLGGAVDRINAAMDGTGITASIDADNGRLVLTGAPTITVEDKANQTTARDLGIVGESLTGTLQGRRVAAEAGTTLLSSLAGGAGVDLSVPLSITRRDGTELSVDLSGSETIEDVIAAMNAAGGGTLTAKLNDRGTGLEITDAGPGAGSLLVEGAAAEALGISTTANPGVNGVIDGNNLQLRWVGEGTTLASLNNGKGIGTGSLRITDGLGGVREVSIDDDVKTVGDLLRRFNSDPTLQIEARVNANGDGIEIVDTSGGGVRVRVEDVSGSVAQRLNLEGQADEDGPNTLNGSLERTISFDPGDTLDDIVSKINDAGAGVRAGVLRDGSGATPFRLTLTARDSGSTGRVVIDSGDFDLDLRTLDEGNDARMFYGSADPASAVLLTSTSNRFDGVIAGVQLDAKGVSDSPVQINVEQNSAAVEEKVQDLVDAYNGVLTRIDFQTRYDEETEARGPLLGDGTMIQLRRALSSQVIAGNKGFTTDFNRLSNVGISVGENGQLEFDTQRFREAMEEDPGAVADLFSRRDAVAAQTEIDLGNGITARDPDARQTFGALGVVAQLEQLAESYVTSLGGVLTRRNQSLQAQMTGQENRIAGLQSRLDNKRLSLERQFATLDSTLARLQSQQQALAQLG